MAMRDCGRLGTFLQKQSVGSITLSFRQIGEIVGSLPMSALKYPAWWANQVGNHHPQTKAWRDFGFRTEGLDLGAQKVTFVKV